MFQVGFDFGLPHTPFCALISRISDWYYPTIAKAQMWGAGTIISFIGDKKIENTRKLLFPSAIYWKRIRVSF
jgi:hypothetical protein